MATIRPFQGLRYSAEAGPIDMLTAPPYDVLSQGHRDDCAARNPHNVVHLTVPDSSPEDRSKFVKYARAAALLAAWRRDGTLLLEPKPSIYRYQQTFNIPGLGDLVRTSIVALLKVEPYEKGIVLPHEETFPKHKEDRLRLLEATRAHLECIFGLFEDPGGKIHEAIVQAPTEGVVETTSEDGTLERIEPISDPGVCQRLASFLEDKKVWIADGHHRYETACNFRAALGERDGVVAEDYMMMAFSSMSDPGLVLLPTHRVLTDIPVDSDTMFARLGQHFRLKAMHNTRLMESIEEDARSGRVAFGLALPGGDGYVLEALDPESLYKLVPGDGSQDLKRLDVTVLHKVILEQLLELKGLDAIKYTRDSHQATTWVNEGDKAAFLMNPPTVDDMRRIALGGEKMPQKSTYYFPKLLSGLVMWSLNDFNP